MIYGLIGSGKTTLAETLFGTRHTYHAEIDGQTITIKTPRDAIKAKIALVPEERRKQGVFLSEDIISHTNLHQSGWRRKQTEVNNATTAISSFSISPNDPKAFIHSLSGGNINKKGCRELLLHSLIIIFAKTPVNLQTVSLHLHSLAHIDFVI